MSSYRWERDWMGKVRVPAERRYGAQTARALVNFSVPPPGFALGEHPDLVRAMLLIKHAAARANVSLETLEPRRGQLIEKACDAVLRDCDLRTEFPVSILHGGGGTSANMNVNEVVAHVANSIGRLGSDGPSGVDPLDHVNKNQSTNSVYPTACRLALLDRLGALIAGLRGTESLWGELSDRIGHLPRLARTCLQDAVKSDFASLFGGYEAATGRCRNRLETAESHLHTISLGGGVAGQPDASPERYRTAVTGELRRLTGRDDLRSTSNFADAAQNADELLELAHALEALARVLLKQSQDLRILASGPEGGLGEIALPALQPGSSAIPGKVNPVIPEFVAQCAMQTIAASTACGIATDQAELDLNVWEGVYAHNLSTTLSLLLAAIEAWNSRCLAGLEVDEALNRERAEGRA